VLPELDPDREVYVNAPLQLVACEVNYALAPGDMDAARDGLYERLADVSPMPGPAPAAVTLEIGPAGAVPQLAQGFRFLNLERTWSVVVSPVSIVLETSRYHRFEVFLDRVVQAVEALGAALRVAATPRIGLRYIDEVPSSASQPTSSTAISPSRCSPPCPMSDRPSNS
jgi:uncharacterized protein (TIGR04255 family)